uniref:Putative secreted protein n=1 Tax=Ixodes ricinus TaxID=34613 RepID=A0A6B0U1V4_IXORI
MFSLSLCLTRSLCSVPSALWMVLKLGLADGLRFQHALMSAYAGWGAPSGQPRLFPSLTNATTSSCVMP